MWNRLRILGPLSVALLCGTSLSFAGELTNVTLGRSQDFTVVTLYGDGPMSVTHQIVEAKDGKPHRIVVDITGVQHKLPQNNFTELPAGSITTIRTSQFAVSPEPVVRVVLDLAHPAAYKLENSDNQVRVMVSLPGDPPLEKVWSARDGGMNSEPFAAPAAYAEAGTTQASESEPAATEPAVSAASTSTEQAPSPALEPNDQGAQPEVAESTAAANENATHTPDSQSEPAEQERTEPSPAWNNPAKSGEPQGDIKSLPMAPSGKLAASDEQPSAEAAASETSTNEASPEGAPLAEAQTASDAPTSMDNTANAEPTTPNVEDGEATPAEAAGAMSTEAEPIEAGAEQTESAPAQAAFAEAAPADQAAQEGSAQAEPETQASEPEAEGPQVPMPDKAIEQPERVIDYNLPVPAGLAGYSAESEPATENSSAAEAGVEGAPKLAVKPSQAESETSEPASGTPEATTGAPTGADQAVSDSGSAQVASLTTLPPLSESAAELVPQRTQVIYHTQGRRDPFKPLLQSGGYNAAALPDVSSLRLVGLLHDVKESWGLFEDANGYGYILRKGDRVKNGTLTQLTNNRAYFNLTEFGWSRSVHIDLEPEG